MSSTDHTDTERHPESTAITAHPSRTNTVVGAVVVLALLAVLVATGGLVGATMVSALSGLCLALLVVSITQTRHPHVGRLLAACLVLPTGLLLVGGLALATRAPTQVGALALTLGVGVATGGAIAAPWSPITRGGLLSAGTLCLLVLTTPLLALVGYVSAASIDIATPLYNASTLALDTLLATSTTLTGYPAAILAFALLFVTAWALRAALAALPIVELAPAARRDDAQAITASISHALSRTGHVALVCTAVCIALTVPALRAFLTTYVPPLALQLPVIVGTATALRLLILVALAVALVAVVTVRFVVYAARRRHDRLVRWTPAALVGLLVTAVVARGAAPLTATVLEHSRLPASARDTLTSLLVTHDPLVLGLFAAVALGTIPLTVCTLLLILDYATLPARGQSAALASTGLFVAALGSLMLPTMPLASFAAIAGSLLAWDVSWHAVTVGDELGRRTQTRHIELVHAGGSLLIAALAVVLATGALLAIPALPTPPETVAPFALVATFVAILVFAFGLQSR